MPYDADDVIDDDANDWCGRNGFYRKNGFVNNVCNLLVILYIIWIWYWVAYGFIDVIFYYRIVVYYNIKYLRIYMLCYIDIQVIFKNNI